MSEATIQLVIQELQTLPEALQQEVLLYTQRIKSTTYLSGTLGHDLLPLIGTITQTDLEEMRQTIETDCEAIDLNEW